ncbi:MAG: diaminopimelate decarboxylase [Proteobacteria bacterium]|nr:diaminopimelate decarboxylase [Pseudomonadota bacterium]
MDFFHSKDQQAFCENVALAEIAKAVGTPCYVYSRASLLQQAKRMLSAFANYPTLPCYAVKANSNLSVLREIFALGFGADIVSFGELQRSLIAGVDPKQLIYSGVGKRADEISAALRIGILAFNIESSAELEMIANLAAGLGLVAAVSLRVNPNIDAKTNPKITTGLFSTKFGLIEAEARAMAERIHALPSLRLIGVGCHIGSQIVDLAPLAEASRRLVSFAEALRERGHPLEFIDMGGGLGICYNDETPPTPEAYAEALLGAVRETGLKLLIEPGRVIVGNAGVLLSSVLSTKKTPAKNFLIVDAAMNDLIRPAMYDAYHDILPVVERSDEKILIDVVGPICETGDYFGVDRLLPPCADGDLIYLRSAGAYGSSMASNYNSRPRAPEVLVDGRAFRVIRQRESLEDLWRLEL